jgi:MFS family permease
VANLGVGTLFAWSLVAPRVVADVGAGSGAGVFALALVSFTATLPWVARGLRRRGPRPLLGAAAVLAGAGLGLTAAAQRPESPWIGIGLLFGAANGLAYGVAASLAARVVAQRRGLASGLVVGAYAAGPVVLGLVAPRVLADGGWRPAVGVLAVVVTGLVGLAAALAPGGPAAGAGGGSREAPARVPRRTVAALWLLLAGGTLPGLVLFATAAPRAAAAGLDAAAAGVAVSLLAAGNLVGRVGAGWWSDRVGRPPAVATALTVAVVGLGGLAVPTVAAAVLTGFAATGLAYGAVSALVPAAAADRVGPQAFPSVYGRIFTAWGCAGLAAPLLADPAAGSAWVAVLAVPLVVAAAALASLAR